MANMYINGIEWNQIPLEGNIMKRKNHTLGEKMNSDETFRETLYRNAKTYEDRLKQKYGGKIFKKEYQFVKISLDPKCW